MKASELSLGSLTRMELLPHGSDGFGSPGPLGEEVVLAYSPDLGATLRMGGRTTAVRGVDARTQRHLDDILQRNLPRIAWLVQVDSDDSGTRRVMVQNHDFPRGLDMPDTLVMYIDDDLIDQLARSRGLRTVEQIELFLREECVLESHGRPSVSRLVASTGRSDKGGLGQGFRVHGPRVSMDVHRRAISGKEGSGTALFVKRVVASRRGAVGEGGTMLLVDTALTFKDASKGSLASEVRSELDGIVQQAGSYLGLWGEYNDLERRIVEAEATEFGSIAYTNWTEERDGVRFQCSQLDGPSRERLRGCSEDRVDLQATEEPAAGTDTQTRGRIFVGEPIRVENGGVIVRPRGDDPTRPPAKGFLSVSVIGDRKRLQRRERARDLVAAARCPVPWLGMLLEGKPFAVTRRKRDDPLSPASRRAFKGDPTPAQEMAVDAALNTPDIAIIQGPPGTGKTRVIAALQARLAELGEGDNGPFGQTLLTSYQHDAVDNVAAASVAFGLPSFRVGGKTGQADDDDSTELWRRDLVGKLKGSIATQTTTPIHVVRRNLRRLLLAQQLAPADDGASLGLLRQVRAEAGPYLDASLTRALDELDHSLSVSDTVEDMPLERQVAMQAVSGLPTTADSAADDGPRRARKAMLALESLGAAFLGDLEREVLTAMAEWDRAGQPPGLSMLGDIRTSLLGRLRPARTQDDRPRRNDRIETVLVSVYALIDELARTAAFDASVAIEDLIDDLEADPQAVRDEVARYASTLAATVQHAVGVGMQTVKLSGADPASEEWPRFRNVIVDEAARCNPLDLMIPLSIAERRIVLVGDHRQLPHVLEPGIERELSKTASEATAEALGLSLFERLVNHVRTLEQKDGIKRYVRLDTQYRMPPALGKFVSDAFYAPHGEQFTSGRSAEEFEHDLGSPYAGKVAAWIDVPRELGEECGGKSKSREAEAVRVAAEVKALAEGRPDLSIGVITFYRDQVDELNRALSRHGIVERDSQGQWHPTAPWKATTGPRESRARLRIGTVDSFQGMEFDVVLLSLVRCNRYPTTDQQWLRKKFGFLLLENRVCVAMSRQQRLLIAVGDSAMLRDDVLAHEPGVAALRSFLELCGGPNGVRI